MMGDAIAWGSSGQAVLPQAAAHHALTALPSNPAGTVALP
jgi:hypothetical protein